MNGQMKVGIVGAGYVGATAAYAMVMRGIGREVVLVDKNADRACAEADDIRHAVPFAEPLEISAGDFDELGGCRVVLLCAGVGQRPGESRLDLLKRNAAVFHEIVPKVMSRAAGAVLVVATNPVDVMTHLAAQYAAECGVPSQRVLGSGTTLDSARFRTLLAARCGVDPHHVHGYVVGEHGDSEVLTWSLATVGTLPLEEFARLRQVPLGDAERQEVDRKVRCAAQEIICGKAATYYGIGSALARIIEVILHDQRSILTVCTPEIDVHGVRDVTVSLPRLIGGSGILQTLPLPLTRQEESLLIASARVIRTALDEIA